MTHIKQIKNKKTEGRLRRRARIRSHISGNSDRPRLVVFKSNRSIYAQIIDDSKGITLVSASSLKEKKGALMEKAVKIGGEIAALAKKKKIKKVVFDRGGFRYTGHVKALADSARKGGLQF